MLSTSAAFSSQRHTTLPSETQSSTGLAHAAALSGSSALPSTLENSGGDISFTSRSLRHATKPSGYYRDAVYITLDDSESEGTERKSSVGSAHAAALPSALSSRAGGMRVSSDPVRHATPHPPLPPRDGDSAVFSQSMVLKLLRPINSCAQCKRRRRKCDRERPCGQCIKYHFDCVYVGEHNNSFSVQRLSSL